METTKRPTDELRHQIEALRNELTSLRDEARVQRHLLSMDLRDRLDALDTRRAQLQESAERATEHTIGTIRQSLSELRASFAEIVERAKKPESPAAKH